MHHSTMESPKVNALLRKIAHLPILPRRKQRLRQFREPNAHLLFLLHSVTRNGKRYAMQCDTQENGTREVSFESVHNSGKPTRCYRPKRHFRDPFTGRLFFR